MTTTNSSKKWCANDVDPAFPIHPGWLMKEEIEYRGLSQKYVAEQMNISYSVLNEILNEKRALTWKTAMIFEAVLGVDAKTLMNMQNQYNGQIARMDNKFMTLLSKINKIAVAL